LDGININAAYANNSPEQCFRWATAGKHSELSVLDRKLGHIRAVSSEGIFTGSTRSRGTKPVHGFSLMSIHGANLSGMPPNYNWRGAHRIPAPSSGNKWVGPFAGVTHP